VGGGREVRERQRGGTHRNQQMLKK
jgi:hypothetical protein